MAAIAVLVPICILVIAMGAQVVFSQDEGEGGSEGGCPPLNPGKGSMKIVCEENQQPSSCKTPGVGTVARTVWKKDVLKQGKGVAAVKCGADGTWKKMAGGGGGGGGKSGYQRMGDLGTFKISLVAATYPIAVRMCEQDGGRVMALDSAEKQTMIEEIKATKNPPFLHAEARFADDIWAGISNMVNPDAFKTSAGESPDEIPRYGARKGKTGAPNSCLIYNIITKEYWVVPCSENRGFLCEMPK